MFRKKRDPQADRVERTDRLRAAAWELPAALRRDEPPRSTLVGPAGGPCATVDDAGAVSLVGAGWSLDWWVGADDRWRVPAAETGVRQALLPGVPGVETAVRVPAGDAVQRCWAVPGAIVIEVENRSPSPFALALSVRPITPTGAGHVGEVAVEGEHILVDGRVALVLPVRPGRAATSTGSRGDVAAIVLGGTAGPAAEAARCEDGLASAAVVVPVAHRTTFRCTIPLGDAAPQPPGSAASLDAVERGWAAQDRAGLAVDLPDAELAAALGAARRSLLVLDPDEPGPARDAALAVAALGAWGRHAEADEVVRSLWVRERTDGSFDEPDGRGAPGGPHLFALGDAWRRRPDVELLRNLEDGVRLAALALLERVRRGRLPVADARWARVGAAVAADMAGEAGMATVAATLAAIAVEARRPDPGWSPGPALVALPPPSITDLEGGVVSGVLHLAASIRAGAAAGSPAALTSFRAMLEAGRPTWSWPLSTESLAAAPAAFLLAGREILVSEPAAGHAALLPLLDPTWIGQGVEVLRAPLFGGGTVSYAIRWHGERPALLWDVVGAPRPVRLTAPGIDRSFSSEEAKGEALLAAPSPPT